MGNIVQIFPSDWYTLSGNIQLNTDTLALKSFPLPLPASLKVNMRFPFIPLQTLPSTYKKSLSCSCWWRYYCICHVGQKDLSFVLESFHITTKPTDKKNVIIKYTEIFCKVIALIT